MRNTNVFSSILREFWREKSGLCFSLLLGHPKSHFWAIENRPFCQKCPILGTKKWDFGCPILKTFETFCTFCHTLLSSRVSLFSIKFEFCSVLFTPGVFGYGQATTRFQHYRPVNDNDSVDMSKKGKKLSLSHFIIAFSLSLSRNEWH